MPAYKDQKNNTWYVKYSQKEMDGNFTAKLNVDLRLKEMHLNGRQKKKEKFMVCWICLLALSVICIWRVRSQD